MTEKKYFAIFIILAIFSGILFFWKLGENTLTNWDESWYADISRNMATKGNFITPFWNTKPFFDKPPLYFWFTVPVLKIFGISEFSARFISALSAFSTGVIVYFLGRLLFNSRAAIISFIILNSTIAFLFRSRTGNLDSLLTFFIILSIFAFYRGLKVDKRWFLVMGMSVGLGFLTKGMISFLFPLVAILYLFFTKRFKMLKSKFLLTGIFIAIFIALSWLIPSFLVNGKEFIYGFSDNQSSKISTTFNFWRNFSFEYINHLKSGLKVWFIILIPSFIYIMRRWKNTDLLVILLYFLTFGLVLFFSENKSNWFLMPLYPIIALIIGYFLERMQDIFLPKKFSILLITSLLLALSLNIKYKNEYIVPDISINEAKVALAAKSLTKEDDSIYLTNYYYPTTVYYSQRRVYSVYSDYSQNKSWWIKSKNGWQEILKNKNVVIITTDEELKDLGNSFKNYKFELKYRAGNKILLKKI